MQHTSLLEAARAGRVEDGLQTLFNSTQVSLIRLLALLLVIASWTVPVSASESAGSVPTAFTQTLALGVTPQNARAHAVLIKSTCTQETMAFAWPVSGMITQGYWWGHQALDIGAPYGRDVLAAADGRVSFVGWTNTGYGYLISLEHDQGYSTYYAHLSRMYVAQGEAVSRGQAIGAVGSTGNSTGPHLHLEIHRDDVRLDPLVYLSDDPDKVDWKTCPAAE